MVRTTLFSALAILLISFSQLAFPQSTPPPTAAPANPLATIPPMPKDPIEILDLARTYNDLEEDGLHPWHISANYEVFDSQGKSQGKGTFEESWVNSKQYKISYTSGDFTQTKYVTANGLYQAGSSEFVPYPESLISKLLVQPMPEKDDILGSQPELHKQDFGKTKLDCVMLTQKHTHAAYPLFGLFPTYCFDTKYPMVRFQLFYGTVEAVFNSTVLTQNRFLAQDITVSAGGKMLLKIHVNQINLISTTDQKSLLPPADARHVDPQMVQVSGGEMQKRLLKQVQPIYPQKAKEMHLSGVVVLQAIVATDGHIRDLRILPTSYAPLAEAALTAVRGWVFKPYLVDGKPVEVKTIVKIIFHISL
ncbi:MAG: energy transducer TonB [Acidobacteriaceae bacterium]